MESLLESIDIYCERTAAGFWGEPVNALSNLAFVIVSIGVYLLARRSERVSLDNLILIKMCALIGVGSFLFHTLANRWTSYLDIFSIWVFVFAYVLFALRQFFEMEWAAVFRNVAIVCAISGLVLYIAPSEIAANNSALNGSEQYLPAVLALFIFGGALSFGGHRVAKYVWAATIVFLISLFFRTIDHAVCATLPQGTHFGWHIGDAVMVGLLLVAKVRHGISPSTSQKMG